ncbi:MAG: hypothetical protein CMD34_06640 [Flavobacteriales bacterium]|nr:hypothetical protein [Flavobacteriales bacterium]
MSSASKKLIQAAGGAAGAGGAATYVDDVFSTYLYHGNGSAETIRNGILLGDGAENNTTLQITGDGSISDDSPFGYSLTSSSSMTTSTSVKKFGSGSMHFPYNATLPTVSASTDSAPQGTEDFTIEGWIYHSAANGSFRTIYASGYPIQLYVNSNNIIAYCSSSTTSPSYFVNGIGGPSNSLQDNTWTHFAFVRNGNNFTVYVNGNAGTGTTSSSAVAAASRSILGGFSTTLYGICTSSGENAYIDDFRITRGRAVYTSNFTPPTAALDLDTAVTGEGGMVWIKNRSSGGSYTNHAIVDSERVNSSTYHKSIYPNLTEAEYDPGSSVSSAVATSFNSDGFSLGNNSNVNFGNGDYVSWTFRKQPGFFDVVTYTGNGTNQTISHNLGSVPGMMIVKRTDSSTNGFWIVYHRSTSGSPQNDYMILNSTQSLNQWTDWNQTAPTSTEFSVGSAYTNTSSATYVAYLFAHDAQDFGEDSDEAIIKCGSYTGNGSSNGPTIDLGFEPQWLLIKSTNTTDSWLILDTMRGISTGGNDSYLYPNLSNAEVTTADRVDVTPTGFKVTSSSGQVNDNTYNYIYMAIRRPHKPASEFAATDMFSPIVGTSSSDWIFDAGFPVDLHFYSKTSNNRFVFDRLRENEYLMFNSDAAGSAYTCDFDYMNYCDVSGSSNNGWTMYNFKRTPGFFDMVTYAGTGSSGLAVNHNLGVTPELVIIKNRTYSPSDWPTLTTAVDGSWDFQLINSTGAFVDGTWFTASASDFTLNVATSRNVNYSGNNYISYLFATAPGISKVGTYTGTGANGLDIDCGFTNGARFVLIKRTDSTGDWYLFDSARGIVAGNDPYFLLNSTSYSDSTDYIEPLSSGFQLNNGGNGSVNISGANYLFFAIA